ncbi:MAG TPA: nicotinate-nucleotide--dimethylbenzimidazole phosphoribosyltransferase [Burkholderiaceae bacterium]|nr:nicotinate-nucleotide--dimethylbenzimidazole phosphoribosyltransferase [Burkholderiaceae bacterium]
MAAILTDPSPAGADRCAGCGAPFDCGIDRPEGCWCARLPALAAPPAPGAGCLCETCLATAIERERVRDALGIAAIAPLDDPALEARTAAAWAAKTMPAGALGGLQALGTRLARIAGRVDPRVERGAVVVFAADHGLAAEGVSAYPSEVTAQMVRNFGEGGAAISVLCRANGLELVVVDAGARVPQPAGFAPAGARFVDARIAAGTASPLSGAPAMSDAQALEAMRRGAAIVRGVDADAIGLGEMGIGNSSSAALLAARLAPAPIEACVGRGTGLDDARLAHKRAVLARCLDAHPRARTPLAALAAFGGFEIAMMAGAVLACAADRRPVVIDGFIGGAAALVAARLEPAAAGRCVFAHRSAELGHAPVLRALDAEPLLDLGMRLGEGSGAALAMPMLRAAARLLAEMATFESAGVVGRTADGPPA